MKDNTKFSLIIITLISICIFITLLIQDFRIEVYNPLMSLILGSTPSFFYTLGMLLICFLVVKKEYGKSCFYVFLGSLIYEFSQLINSERRTFDYLDVLAICMAFLLFTLFIQRSGYLLKLKKFESKNSIK